MLIPVAKHLRAVLQRQHRRRRVHIVNAVCAPVAHQPLDAAIVEDRRAGVDKAPGRRTGGRTVVDHNAIVVVIVGDGGGIAEGRVRLVRIARRAGRTGRCAGGAAAVQQVPMVAGYDLDAIAAADLVDGGGGGGTGGAVRVRRSDDVFHVLGEAGKEVGVERLGGLRKHGHRNIYCGTL